MSIRKAVIAVVENEDDKTMLTLRFSAEINGE